MNYKFYHEKQVTVLGFSLGFFDYVLSSPWLTRDVTNMLSDFRLDENNTYVRSKAVPS